MSSNREPDRVVDLAAARARKLQQAPSTAARTIILQVASVRADGESHRQIGVTDSLQLGDLCDVLAVAFALRAPAPCRFLTVDGAVLSNDADIRRYLGRVGNEIIFEWGLWKFTVTAAHSWPRDNGTPWALCVGGSGRFGDTGFDIAQINAELTGTEMTRDVLARTHPAVCDIIDRSRLFDLVPLLQALDLGREVDLDDDVRARLATLPRETDTAGIDAFWAQVLALSCLTDNALAEHIAEQIMAALGWVDDDGGELSAAGVRALCAESLEVLCEIGVYGQRQVATVDKLDIFRGLLRSSD